MVPNTQYLGRVALELGRDTIDPGDRTNSRVPPSQASSDSEQPWCLRTACAPIDKQHMPLREFDLGPVLEHALCELDGNFQLHSERQATVLVPTAYLPPAYLDALGIPEAEPVHLLYTFSGSW